MSGSSGSNTTTSSQAPPAEYLAAYQNVNQQAQNVAKTPFQPYQGNVVAPFAPGQIQGMQQVQDATANGGVQQPYLQAATKSLLNAQTPLWQNVNQFSPSAVNTYESPYTQKVVDATQKQFDNANAIQQQGVVGNAISKGGWGGDRSAVAQAITAGQQQLAQAPVIAGLENQGYTQALGEFNNQQAAQLGANEANAWLGSQAGALFGNLGQEAQTTALTGANANLGIGAQQQGMGQELLNVPYEQNIAAQALPYQQTGWLANIAEGLGGASGGTSSTTSPGASVGSQVAGLGTGAVGVLGATGAFGSNGYLTGGGAANNAIYAPSNYQAPSAAASYYDSGYKGQRGGSVPDGMVPRHASGGGVPDVSLSVLGGSPASSPSIPSGVPDESLSPIPGASGMGTPSSSHGTQDILKNFGSTSTTTPTNADSTFGTILKDAGIIAASVYGGPAGGQAASALSSQVHFAKGGMIPREHFEVGGMAASAESPWWERAAASQMDRHGLLASPIAGRTDQLAISPAAGSYVVPADVVSGLGEGNTLAGANIMQCILDTGPHGLKMPVHSHSQMGPPRAPPAYNEGSSGGTTSSTWGPHAKGGEVQKRADGGANNDMAAMNPYGPSNPPPPMQSNQPSLAPIEPVAMQSNQPSMQTQMPQGMGPHLADGGMIPHRADGGMAPLGASVANNVPQGSGPTIPSAAYAAPSAPPNKATANGGYTSLQDFLTRGSSAAPQTSTPAMPMGTSTSPGSYSGINPSIGTGVSQTGLPALDSYLNNVMSGASFARPTSGPPPSTTPSPPAAAPPPPVSNPNPDPNLAPYITALQNAGADPNFIQHAKDAQNTPYYGQYGSSDGGGGMKRGGMIPHYASAGAVPMGDGNGMLGQDPGDDVLNFEVNSSPETNPLVPPGMPPGAAMMPSNAPATPSGEMRASNPRFHTAQADPWLALAEAGFGMAAGRSPHALENIGAGAKEGIQRYIQQKQEANKENLQADIWGGKQSLGQAKNDISRDRAETYAMSVEARNGYYQAQADKLTQETQNGGKPETFKYVGNDEDGNPQLLGSRGTMKIGTQPIGLTTNQEAQAGARNDTNEYRKASLKQRADQFIQTQQGRDLDREVRAKLGDNAEAGRTVGRIALLVNGGMSVERAKQAVYAETARARNSGEPTYTAPVVISPAGPSAPMVPAPTDRPDLSKILPP